MIVWRCSAALAQASARSAKRRVEETQVTRRVGVGRSFDTSSSGAHHRDRNLRRVLDAKVCIENTFYLLLHTHGNNGQTWGGVGPECIQVSGSVEN